MNRAIQLSYWKKSTIIFISFLDHLEEGVAPLFFDIGFHHEALPGLWIKKVLR